MGGQSSGIFGVNPLSLQNINQKTTKETSKPNINKIDHKEQN
jgi:hypothetical protein